MSRYALIDTAELTALHAKLDALSATLARVTIAPAPEWVTVAEAAKLHGVTTGTVRRWVRKGEIEARGSGRARMVKVR